MCLRKGRCNLANDCDRDSFFASVRRNPRFLYSAYDRFGAEDTLQFFRDIGLEIKVERGNRVFPVSDKSSDVIRVLEHRMKALNVSADILFSYEHLKEEKEIVAEIYGFIALHLF